MKPVYRVHHKTPTGWSLDAQSLTPLSSIFSDHDRDQFAFCEQVHKGFGFVKTGETMWSIDPFKPWSEKAKPTQLRS